MKRTVIYARFSSDNQRKESIDEQIRACKYFAQQSKDYDVIGIYSDEALSGYKHTHKRAGLSVSEGELTFKGAKWDCMSASEQLRVATAIVRKLNPECGFVLLDKLEQMDTDTLNEFGEWLAAEGLQAIATRVSTGGECSIIIEDGYVKGENEPAQAAPKTWKAGEF